MTKQNIYNLKINEDFKRLIPPLSSEELNFLELSIIRDGYHEPLNVWNNTLIDDYNQYEICTRLQIPFAIKCKNFKSHEEVISWICRRQLKRLNITDEARRYLIGKRYEMEKNIRTHITSGLPQHKKNEINSNFTDEKNAYFTSVWLAKEYRISHSTVEKYGIYSKALDEISKVLPSFVIKILSGQIKISQENIVELSRLSPPDIMSLHITDETRKVFSYSDIRKMLPKRQTPHKKLVLPLPNVSIKEMPAYDPDAEISSLTLTIPSWVSSINRTRSVANFRKISINARCNLMNELLALMETIDAIYLSLKEET